MTKPKKILIIKTGFSEFLDRGISTTVSLGDVLNCTALLNLYKEDCVTWVTSWDARRLLQDNPYIDDLLIFGPDTFDRLLKRPFDVLINLEKDIGICTFLDKVKAPKRYGFYFDAKTHNISAYKSSTSFLLMGQENHVNVNKTLLEILFESVNARWRGEGLVFHWQSKKKIKYDVGFNYSVGSKWPTKAWPMEQWRSLEKLLKGKYTVSWQKGHRDLLKYIDWISSCRLIVTSDSLGQSLGHVLGKKVITLFGSTNPQRMEKIENITTIASTLKCPHMPCYLPVCKFSKFCMDYIPAKEVARQCRRILG